MIGGILLLKGWSDFYGTYCTMTNGQGCDRSFFFDRNPGGVQK
jgi:hypothetical protein